MGVKVVVIRQMLQKLATFSRPNFLSIFQLSLVVLTRRRGRRRDERYNISERRRPNQVTDAVSFLTRAAAAFVPDSFSHTIFEILADICEARPDPFLSLDLEGKYLLRFRLWILPLSAALPRCRLLRPSP